jgi:hypothetical protein
MDRKKSVNWFLTGLYAPWKRLSSRHVKNTGWDLKIAASLKTTDPLTAEELNILRDELDPDRIYLKGGE